MEVEVVIRQYVVTLQRNVDILDTQKGSFACPQVDPNLIPTNHQYRRLAITKKIERRAPMKVVGSAKHRVAWRMEH